MALEESKKDGDVEIKDDGLTLLLDRQAALYLSGATIDYQKSFLGEGFSIRAPGSSHC